MVIVVCTCAWTISSRSTHATILALQSAVIALDAHVSQVVWSNQVKAKLARFYKLDIAVSAVTRRALSAYLLFSRHDRCGVTWTSRARLTMLHCSHLIVLTTSAHLAHDLIRSCNKKYVKIILEALLYLPLSWFLRLRMLRFCPFY